MKTQYLKYTEISSLLILSVVFFLSIKNVLPNFVSIILILLISFYFVPIKLIIYGKRGNYLLGLISDIIVFMSLPLLIVFIYLKNTAIIDIFTTINFLFLVFFVFKNKNTSQHWKIVLNHSIVIFLLELIKYS